jgi:hypothetical protein
MAKMSRGNLKSLVKECLFEILLESTDTPDSTAGLSESIENRLSNKRTRNVTSRSLTPPTEPARREQKKLDVSHLTADPIMAAIFEDTAQTTLVEQADAERGKVARGRGDAAAQVAAENNPSQLFGAAAENWAALAFDD